MENLANLNLFNIDLVTNLDNNSNLPEITSPNIFETSSTNFDRNGLYSVDIFGPIDSERRRRSLAYINLKLPILHPLVYKHITTLYSTHKNILEGKVNAYFDPKLGDFVLLDTNNENNGNTGYEFYIQHFPNIKFKPKNIEVDDDESNDLRNEIRLIKKFQSEKHLITKWLVIPAGLRDYRVSSTGKSGDDEINNLYRNLIRVVKTLDNFKITKDNIATLDLTRLKIQKTVIEIYDYLTNMLNGKHKFIQGKWVKRALTDGTRNVITPTFNIVNDLDDPDRITNNHTVVGIYQYAKAISNISKHHILNKYSRTVFDSETGRATLVDPKTMELKTVMVKPAEITKWLTQDGLDNILNSLKYQHMLEEPIKVGDYYFKMVYDTGDTITVINTADDVLPTYDKKKLRPLTYGEMVYLAVYNCIDKYPALVTRYPVLGEGSIYPCKVKVDTTLRSRTIDYKNGLEQFKVVRYPIIPGDWKMSTSVAINHIEKMGGDYDGDCLISMVFYRKKIEKKRRVKKTTGKFKWSLVADYSKLFFNNILLPWVNNKTMPKENKMPVNDKMIVYKNGLVELSEFPHGELIKKEGNKEFYKVPDDIEVLTYWNGEEKWVKPESYSIHHNLNMLNVKTHKGNTIECSDDHSLVTLDENLRYKRCNPELGMCIPILQDAVNKYCKGGNYIYKKTYEGTTFNLDNDFGYAVGAIIGDGWVNHSEKLTVSDYYKIMLASTTPRIAEGITKFLREYGYTSEPYKHDAPHEYEGHQCLSSKYQWSFKPFAYMLKQEIGKGAFNKQLPEWWANSPRKFRIGLLEGLLDTDGTVVINSYGKLSVAYLTMSRKLAYQFIALGNSLGLTISLTTHVRKGKDKIEYYLNLSNSSIMKAKKFLNLRHPKKAETLAKMVLTVSEDLYKFTPNARLDKLNELRWRLNYHNPEHKTAYSGISNAINKAKANPEGVGGCFSLKTFKDIVVKHPELFEEDPYWKKFKEIALDVRIEWEVIRSITPIPEVTTAYDLTVPPFNTFVAQNGCIVYDTVSFNVLYTDESVKEIDNYLSKPDFYLSNDNSLVYSSQNDVCRILLQHMTE